MFYNYLIWGDWNPIYLWITFFVVVMIVGFYRNKLKLETSSPKRFRIFLYGSFAFFLYYIMIYNPYPRPIQSLFLLPSTTKGAMGSSLGTGFFTTTLLIVVGVFIVYFIYKKVHVEKNIDDTNSKSA